MKAIISLVGALAACGAAGRPVTYATESAGEVAFVSYQTFGFLPARQPAAPFEVSARSFEVERRIRPLIVAELLRKGYAEQTGEAKPDFVVVFGSAYAQVPPTDPVVWVDPPPIQKGRIAIDAFDASSDAQVWHGTAEAEVDLEKVDNQLLQTAVQQVLAPFPARSPAKAAQAP
jgi:hypothetical protein